MGPTGPMGPMGPMGPYGPYYEKKMFKLCDKRCRMRFFFFSHFFVESGKTVAAGVFVFVHILFANISKKAMLQAFFPPFLQT